MLLSSLSMGGLLPYRDDEGAIPTLGIFVANDKWNAASPVICLGGWLDGGGETDPASETA